MYAIVTAPETVLPDDGEVIVTADEPLPPPPLLPLATVTVVVAVPRLLPPELKAIALTWCEPFATAPVFHEKEVGGVEVTYTPSI